MAIIEKKKWVGLADPYIENEASAVNKTLKQMGVPFYIVCSTRAEKTDKRLKQLSWRRLGQTCNPDYPNATYISEKVVRARLQKDFGVSLLMVRDKPKEAIKKAEEFWAKKAEKAQKIAEKKANKGIRKTKPVKKVKEIKVKIEKVAKTIEKKAEKVIKEAVKKDLSPKQIEKKAEEVKKEVAKATTDKHLQQAVKEEVKEIMKEAQTKDVTTTEIKEVVKEIKAEVKEAAIETPSNDFAQFMAMMQELNKD